VAGASQRIDILRRHNARSGRQENVSLKTYATKAKDIVPKWFVVDGQGISLGRLASKIASILRGKHKPTFAPWMNNGDFVIVTNASKVRLTGAKHTDKIYYRHSGYPGGLRQRTAGEILINNPENLVERAVRGMLPRNALGKAMLRRLKVYAEQDHPHHAQKPDPLPINDIKMQRERSGS
jgi:large subunit ribosomal protein L13